MTPFPFQSMIWQRRLSMAHSHYQTLSFK
jgi:hypothetical protein